MRSTGLLGIMSQPRAVFGPMIEHTHADCVVGQERSRTRASQIAKERAQKGDMFSEATLQVPGAFTREVLCMRYVSIAIFFMAIGIVASTAGCSPSPVSPLSKRDVELLATCCDVHFHDIAWVGAALHYDTVGADLYCRFRLKSANCAEMVAANWVHADRLNSSEMTSPADQSYLELLDLKMSPAHLVGQLEWWRVSPIRKSDLILVRSDNDICLVRAENGKCNLYIRASFGRTRLPAGLFATMAKGKEAEPSSRIFPSNLHAFIRTMKEGLLENGQSMHRAINEPTATVQGEGRYRGGGADRRH